MNSKIIATIVLALLLFSFAFAQETVELKPTWGVGLDFGVQKPYCDILHTGLGLVGGGNVRFLPSDAFNLNLGVGYGMLNDGFSYHSFVTDVMNLDLKGNVNLLQGNFRPYVSFGLGAINYEYQHEDGFWWAKGYTETIPGDPTSRVWEREGKRYWDMSFILGGGIEYMINPNWSVNAYADYRHTNGDGIDGAVQGDSNDGYLNSRIGFTYFVGHKEKPKTFTEEELIALEETSNDFSNLEESMAQDDRYDELKTRLEELNTIINDRDQDIADLQAQINLREDKIYELEKELAQVEQSTAIPQTQSSPVAVPVVNEFKAGYETAMRHFYNREYDQGIAIFSALKAQYPNHKLASNCQYWIGECNYGKRNYSQAIQAFQAVYNYGFSYKFDDAAIMLARSYKRLGDVENARRFAQKLINEYPESEYTGQAQSLLAKL